MKHVAGLAMHSSLAEILKHECDPEGELGLIQSMLWLDMIKIKSIPRSIAMRKPVLRGVEER